MWVLKEVKQNNRKKIFRFILIIVLILLWIISYLYFYNYESKNKVFKTVIVSPRTIYSTFSSDWKVLYKEQYDLNFQISWTLAKIYKNQWDNVKLWELIANLDDKYLKINLEKANIALKTANANLNAKLATKWQKSDINISMEQIKWNQTSLETNLKDWKINIENAQKNIDSILLSLNNNKNSNLKDIENANKTLNSKQKDLDNAKANLETIISTENLNIKNIIEKVKTEIDISLPLLKKYLRDIDLIAWISNENKNLNDSFEIYLWVKNINSKYLTENSYRKSNNELNSFINNWSSYNYDIDIKPYLDKNSDVINSINEALNNTLEMLKNSISSSNFSQNTIDSYILIIENDINALNAENQKIILAAQNINSAKLALETKEINQNNIISSLELQLNQSKTALEKTQIQSKTNIDDLEQKYNLALLTLSWAKIKLQNNIDLSNSQINLSKANLENKITPFDNRELAPYYVAIENAKIWVNEAKKRLDDSKLYSPINWNLAKLNISKIWTNILLNPPQPFAIIINKNSLYIEAKIEEWDISNVFLWQNVKLTFNSLENLEINWKVSYISDKSETDWNWIVTYKVEILFDKIDKKIKEWFTTQIFFILSKAENIPSLPIEVIKNENNISTITLKNKTIKTVKLWISDWNFVQILDGLKNWDEVIY